MTWSSGWFTSARRWWRWARARPPIYLTEFGWQTGDSATEDWRAQQMSAVALTLSRSNCGIAMLAPYDWINPLTLNESGDFGLVDRTAQDTNLRPAGVAWFNGLAQAGQLRELALCPDPAATGASGLFGGIPRAVMAWVLRTERLQCSARRRHRSRRSRHASRHHRHRRRARQRAACSAIS